MPSICSASSALLRRDGNLAQALMSAHAPGLQGAESYWKGDLI
jgi:hypothetical protein